MLGEFVGFGYVIVCYLFDDGYDLFFVLFFVVFVGLVFGKMFWVCIV